MNPGTGSPQGGGVGRAPYPAAWRQELVETRHGYRVADPYRWLEDSGSVRTGAWLTRQRAVAEHHLASLPGHVAWRRSLAVLEAAGYRSVPVRRGDRTFWLRGEPAADHPVLVVDEGELPGGTRRARVVLDPCAIDPTGSTTLDAWEPAPDGRLLAYQLSAGGTERAELRVIDVDTGALADGPIDHVRYSPVAWLPDGSGFYYVRSEEATCAAIRGDAAHLTRNRRVWLHRLGKAATGDPLVFGANHPPPTGYRVAVEGGRWLLVTAFEGPAAGTELWIADLAACDITSPRFLPVQREPEARTSARIGPDGLLYLLTTLDAARGRVCVTDPAEPDPRHWHELVTPAAGATIDAFAPLTGARGRRLLAVAHRSRGVHELALHEATTGKRRGTVPLPGAGTVTRLGEQPPGGPYLWFGYTDHLTPATAIRYDTRYDTRRGRRDSGIANRVTGAAGDVVTRQVSYRSADGTPVRMFLLLPGPDVERPPGPRPLLLTAYGGFGVAMTPRYHPELLTWVAAGGLAAVPCVRGGGDEGQAWHRAGSRARKPAAIADVHAAAGWLVRHGWTDPSRLCLLGASNGGLLMGAAAVQRPELYRAVACVAPLLDMVRYERGGLGRHWRAEYGSADVPEELGWLLSYSPYHHVRPGTAYPATLLLAKEGDTRVPPWHAWKQCAALQHATSDRRPILLRSIPELGHGATARGAGIAITAEVLAFLAAQAGLDPGERVA
ncbi:prolyl oligopeptidase family serine peptidase [Haloechinothrix sp. LS1_15]|uniref:prolyl oligopeptidase family serine peptidase n=1 Tax=Haloechinothrix sp. LS1_15 TaxID=2652248 RepID=UPI002943FCC4|nr:prolyl oligopeptidase family serine peptidase [Haloechinothrix sp. LS1_15]MDV6011940.1 S9 family peptidase [Haloechinothrix sp. LS1_15]